MVNNVKQDNIRYSFYHISIGQVFIDEPIGFRDDDMEYSRNREYHGVFTLFSNNLEFYAESRAIIKTFYDTYGINGILNLKKEVFGQDETTPNKMIWTIEYEGFLDFTTYTLTEHKATCKFNSSGLANLFKNRESIELEIERTDDLNGNVITEINKESVALSDRDILSVDQSILTSETIMFDVTNGAGLSYYTPIQTEISSQNDDFNEVSVLHFTSTANNFFWVRNSVVSTTLTVDIDLEISSTELGGVPSVSTMKIRKYNWDGAVYNFVAEYDVYDRDNIPNPASPNTISVSQEITLGLDDSLATVFTNTNSYTTLSSLSIKTSEKTTYITNSNDYKFVFVYELLDKISTIISGKTNSFYSEYFGRTALGYSSDGEGALMGFISGLWIRNFSKDADRYKSPLISWKDINTSLNSVLNVGFGVEKIGFREKAVIEDVKYFYQDVVTVVLPNKVKDISRTVYRDLFFSELEFGYNKSGGYEREMGLDEPNVKSSFSTFITAIKNKYTKISKVRSDSYGKEFARRKPQDKFPTDDTKYDEHNWFLDIKDTIGVYTEKLWADRFAKAPTGIFSPETITGAWFSPLNNLLRHSWWFSSGYEKNLGDATSFSSSNGNSEMSTQLIGGRDLKENGSILNYDLDRPRLLPQLIKFNHELDRSIRNQLKGKTTINGREVPNSYGLVEFINDEGIKETGYLKSVKPEGIGQWEIIKYNTVARKSIVVPKTVYASVELFDTDIVTVN